MPFSGTTFTNNVDLEPEYVDLGNRLGAYVIEPGDGSPFIVLHQDLIFNPPLHRRVYQSLLNFHRSLPDIYRLFPLRQFYEDLPPPSTAQQPAPELILIGTFRRQSRCYICSSPDNRGYRLVGGADRGG